MFNDERNWFHKHRLGLFIHWGLYAVHGLQEQEQHRYKIPADEYGKLIHEFNPQGFDPDSWLDIACEHGFEYMVVTAKHHDGFCLWPSRETDYHIGNTPYGKDIIGMLSEACRRRDMPLEFYYSVVDWNQKNYPNIGRHHEIMTDPAHHDLPAYLEFLKKQVTELCSDYGKIYGIWWDINVPRIQQPEIHEMIRRLQPAAVINNRGFALGDYSTPERDIDPENANSGKAGFDAPVEACQSVGLNSWGYRRDEDYYSVLYFQRSIDRILASGGNYLLNVGPDANGRFPDQAMKILSGVGSWYKKVHDALTAAPETSILDNKQLLLTKDQNILYIHCPAGLESSTLPLYPLPTTRMPRRVTLLNTGEEIDWTLEPIVYRAGRGNHLRLRNIPVDELNDTVPIFKLEFI